jgi:UDP-glucose 4-epimerase
MATAMGTKRILVTGGAGYIGSHVARLLNDSGYEVTIFDNLENSKQIVSEKLGLQIIQGDLREAESLNALDSFNFDACLHFAAYASVGDSIRNPEIYFENNVVGSSNLISYLIKHNCPSFIFSSTSEVYGEAKYLPIDEKHVLEPINPYGLSKRMVEQMLEWADKAGKLKYVALRYFNAAGCSLDGLIGEDHEPEGHLIPNVILGVLGKKEFKLTCSKVDTPDQTPIRDYVHVLDLADAHLKALEYLLNGNNSDQFNLGTGTGNSVLQVVEAVEKIAGVSIEKTYGEARAGEPAQKFASNEKAKSILKWNPKYNLEDMVRTTYDYLKSKN